MEEITLINSFSPGNKSILGTKKQQESSLPPNILNIIHFEINEFYLKLLSKIKYFKKKWMYRALRASPCTWSAKNVPVAKRTGPCGSGSWADDVKGSEVGVESPGEMSISCDWRSTLVSSLHDSLSRSRSRSRSRSFSRSLSLAETSSLLLPPLLPPHELQYSRLSDCRDDLPSRIPLLLFERELECLSWPVRKNFRFLKNLMYFTRTRLI